MEEEQVLHILRNPYGWSVEDRKDARLSAADLIEKYKEAYLNMREWAEENGVDTVAYYPFKPSSPGDK